MARYQIVRCVVLAGLLLALILAFKRRSIREPDQAIAVSGSRSESSRLKSSEFRDFIQAYRSPVRAELLPASIKPGQRLLAVIAEAGAAIGPMASERRAALLQEAVDGMTLAELPAMWARLRELPEADSTEAGREFQMRLLQRWAEGDPSAAAEVVSELSAEDRSEAYRRVASARARQNAQGSVAWAKQIPDSESRDTALAAIAQEELAVDPASALALAGSMAPTGNRDELISRAAAIWSENDRESALTWAQHLSDPSLRDRVLASLTTAWSDRDPIAAAQWAIDSVSPGQWRDDAVIGIVQRWAMKDYDSASAWISQFPEGSLRETALANLSRINERQHLAARDLQDP